MSITLEVTAGEHIKTVCSRMVDAANAVGQNATAEFNGVELTARPGSLSYEIMNEYNAEMDRRRWRWENSEEGKAFKARVAADKERLEREGVLPFKIRDRNAWAEHIRNNSDRLGHGITRYAARWANLMEREIANGKSVAEVADKCSHAADLEILSGSAAGFATMVLCHVWEHGDELKKWAKTHGV